MEKKSSLANVTDLHKISMGGGLKISGVRGNAG